MIKSRSSDIWAICSRFLITFTLCNPNFTQLFLKSQECALRAPSQIGEENYITTGDWEFSACSVLLEFFPYRKIFVPSDLHPEPEFSARKYRDLMQRVGKKAGIQFLGKPWALNAYQMSEPTVQEHKSLHRWESWSQINPKLSHEANNQNTAIWMDYCSRLYVDFLLVSARPWPTTLYCTEYKFLPRNHLFLVKPSNLI